MNEHGLVVEHLFLSASDYPAPDKRPVIISHQWVQYILDNCKTVSEVIASDSDIRISESNFKFPIHFHVMDRNGDRAIIEFLNKKMTVYINDTYTVGAIANSTYTESLKYLKNFIGWGGKKAIPNMVSESLNRFTKAADMVKNFPGSNITPIIPYSYSILDSVRNSTQWQIIYDIKNLQIFYRTESNKNIRVLRIDDQNYFSK